MFNSSLVYAATAAALTVGCAGSKGLDRRTGPAYKAELDSWRSVVETHGADGMWMVVRGYHAGDDFIAMAANQEYSHAMVLDLTAGEVIEAVGEGVVVTKLDKVIDESHQIMLIRPRGFSPEKGREAVARARSVVGAGYDYTGIVGAPSSSRYYCSELAAWAWGQPVDRLGPGEIIIPETLREDGDVLFESGERDTVPDTVPAPPS